jgi:hypothetical protein
MAKTKLLAQIETESSEVFKLLDHFAEKLSTATGLVDEHWKLLSDSKTEIDKLHQTVSKMRLQIKSWDGSAKLKNAMKDTVKLVEARKTAIEKFGLLEKQVKNLDDGFSLIQKMMQDISRMK